MAHQFGELAGEGTRLLLDTLTRQVAVFEDEIVGDGHRHHHHVGLVRAQGRMQQAGLRRLHLAAVAPAALDVEEEVVLFEHLRHIRFERHQVGRIAAVPSNRNRTGDVPVHQAERTAKKVDAGGNQRRANAVVVEHERLDEVIGVALVIRGVHHTVAGRRGNGVVQILVLALDFPEDGVERMLERSIQLVPLRRPQFVEIGDDTFPHLVAALAIAPPQVLDDLRPCQHGEGDVIEHESKATIAWGRTEG